MELSITAYSTISSKGAYLNGQLLFANSNGQAFAAFAKELYQHLEPSYAKFYKMDELSKLAFLAAEVLFSKEKLPSAAAGAETAIVLGNKSSSLVSDTRHWESYKDRENYFPSPAVFVYTLPNIMLGELSIRHGITGESSCFLMEEFKSDFLYNYVKAFFEEGYHQCLTGWVEYTEQNYYACLLFVEKTVAGTAQICKFSPQFKNLLAV